MTKNTMKLVSPCCGDRLIPVMESAGSYMGDDFAGMECLECTNTWDNEGELVYTFVDLITAGGERIGLYGHPEEVENKAKEVHDLVEKYGFKEASMRIHGF